MPTDIDSMDLDEGDEIGALMRTLYPSVLRAAYGTAARQVGGGIRFDLANPRVQDTLDSLAMQVARVAETTREEIRGLVGKAAAEGWSIPELAQAIRQLGAIQSSSRARAIARTETTAAYSRGSILAFQDSGVVDEVEWLSTLDELTTPICQELHGKRVKIGAEFAPGIEHPPAHVNCRSAIMPVVRS
jgi:SPP1 gp7 family putative phage head morphogenesis protein